MPSSRMSSVSIEVKTHVLKNPSYETLDLTSKMNHECTVQLGIKV
jgi:hypothetical protein